MFYTNITDKNTFCHCTLRCHFVLQFIIIIIIIIIIRGATTLTNLGQLSSRHWQSFPTAPDHHEYITILSFVSRGLNCKYLTLYPVCLCDLSLPQESEGAVTLSPLFLAKIPILLAPAHKLRVTVQRYV
jgi:hypothetical protein